jgi:hypothetical protein
LGASGLTAGPGYPFQSFLPAGAGKKGFPLLSLARSSRQSFSRYGNDKQAVKNCFTKQEVL